MAFVLRQNAFRFAAKCISFWAKMPSVLGQNALRFGPKCPLFWAKMPFSNVSYALNIPPFGRAWTGLYYLIFNVMMVMAANMMDTIQKRMVIFDSWNGRLGHPFSR